MAVTTHSKFKHEVVETYQDGECIFKEGDTGKDLYIVQQGQVKIFKELDGENLEIAVFDRGDFFGDIGLLQNIPRIASAFACGEAKILVLRPAGFLLKIRRDPTFAFELLQQLSHRVFVSNQRILELVQRHNLSKDEFQKLLRELDGKA
jgi:CRP/FNR family transcriptional regulator, cyclic AMP receptor protein